MYRKVSFTHKGYTCIVEFIEADNRYHGKVLDTDDVVSCEAESEDSAKKILIDALEDYILCL